MFTIGPYEVIFAYDGGPEDDEGMVYFQTEDGAVGITTDNPVYADYLLSAVTTYPPKPSHYHYMDMVGWVWTLDQVRFTPYLLEQMKIYRDQKVAIVIEHDNGSATFDILNNRDSYNGLSVVCQGLPIEHNAEAMIQWKNLDGNYVEAGYDDMQNLFYKCFRREQDGRVAESVVINNHLTTPYTDHTLTLPKADFDTAIGE